MAVPAELLAILACPACRGPLAVIPGGLGCARCRLRYPERDGIPDLVPGDAEPWTPC